MSSDHVGPAFDQLYRASYQRMLAKDIVVCGGNSAVAQDAVQEAFIRCWRRMNDADGPSVENWHAWLSTVVVRECLAALRRLPSTLPLEGRDFWDPCGRSSMPWGSLTTSGKAGRDE